MSDEVLTVAETAERLGVSDDHVYGLIAAGDLKAVKLGRLHRVPRWAVDEMIGRPADTPPAVALTADVAYELVTAVVTVLARRLPGFDPNRLAASLADAGGLSSAPTYAPGGGIAGPPADAATRGERSPGPARLAAVNT